MSDMISPDPGASAEGEAASDRRNFLSRSGLMIAMLALASGEGEADAASTVPFSSSDGPAVKAALSEAMASGKIDPKSPTFLKLSPALRDALSGLSTSDLATLRSANTILASRITSTADNNGTIGM